MPNIYESKPLLEQYMLFHYGSAEDQLPYSFGPHNSLFFPVRCVADFLPDIGPVERALDLGCAVGRSSFELSRWAQQVVGIDSSTAFIEAAKVLQSTGRAIVRRVEEGEITSTFEVYVPNGIDPQRCVFEVGDALNLRKDLGLFDIVLAANLIDRVASPRILLSSLKDLIKPKGFLLLFSPYTWLPEFSSKEEWIGARYKGDDPVRSFDELHATLTRNFDLVRTQDIPFLIREHARKYQWSVAQGTVWQRQQGY
ncbi:MAG: putative 4-mercaptohistidine N1-methyltransferase [Verrucomicrobia bacterium]|nr:putative 4-mercaptohistidine N1-methyltransferase [Verrucomicrobiota bacterium]